MLDFREFEAAKDAAQEQREQAAKQVKQLEGKVHSLFSTAESRLDKILTAMKPWECSFS